MKTRNRMAVLGLALLVAGPAQADFRPLTPRASSNPFGDAGISYDNGVIYDDDLVPGLPPNQPFLAEDGSDTGFSATGTPPQQGKNSRQLIGPDGRIRAR